MSELAVGIDLGTTTTIISVYRNGHAESIRDPISKTPIVPSVVALSRRGELLVGCTALANGTPGAIVREVKRSIGTDERFNLNEPMRAEEISALILRKVKENAEVFLGRPIQDVVVTVPANFLDRERQATKAAVQMAGLNPIQLINEPTAAAMAYGIDHLEDEETLLVYDFGGGTLDVSILEMIGGVLDVKTSHGCKRLGGKDFDDRIIAWAESEFARQHPGATPTLDGRETLKGEAEATKKVLSEHHKADLLVGNYDGHGHNIDLQLTRERFEEMIDPLVRESIDAVHAALAKGGIQLSEITRLVLIGGSTYVPKVRRDITAALGLQPVAGVDPDLAVSQGAAIRAGLATGAIEPSTGIMVQDVASYGLGILAIERIGNQPMLVYNELMPPNTPIPFQVCHPDYKLLTPDQDQLDLEIVQDPSGSARWPDDTVPTAAAGAITGIPPSTTDTPHTVRLDFSYDVSGIVHLKASIPDINKSLTLRLDTKTAALMEAGQKRVADLWDSSPLAPRHAPIIRRAETVLQGDPHNSEYIEAELAALKEFIAKNDAEGAQAARDRLVDRLADAE